MLPSFLLSEGAVHQDGAGAEVALETVGRPLVVTLGITRILECESLEVSIWGSTDKVTWQPTAAFPPKCYCGTYYLPLDGSATRGIRFLRAHWKMRRWEPRNRGPLFDFYVFVEEPRAQVAGAA